VSCQGLYTANTMACMTEALGMSLPGCATAHAVDAKKGHISHASGKRIVELVKKNIKPLDIVSRASFENAIRLDMTIGGSTNTVLHLTAVAAEGGIDLGLDDTSTASAGRRSTSVTWGPAVLSRIKGLNNAPTVSGKDLGEIAKATKVLNPEVIRPVDNPIHRTGGIAILYGNLAPEGAVVKSGAVTENMLKFSGKAKVFDGEDDVIKSILGGGIGHVSPEAVAVGPIGLLQTGDVIEIDIPGKRIDVKLSAAEIGTRKKAFVPKRKQLRGYLARYARNVTSASTGALIKQHDALSFFIFALLHF
jgi:dihydroxy-acid dehydratase